MKKLLAIILCLASIFTLTGCERGTDLEEVQDAEVLVVGITEFEPMNYRDKNGEWTGFDTEFAKLFAKEKLGVEVEFVEIEWSDRYTLLKEFEIDCIWNGMTVDNLQQTEITVSDSYMLNSQILVMKADKVGNFENGYDVRKFTFAAEKGSAGALCVQREGYELIEYDSQQKALEAVSSGLAGAAIVDFTYANVAVGKGKKFPTLGTGFAFSSETYAVGFRKDSDLAEQFNEFLKEIYDDELLKIANKYGLTLY